MKGETRRRCCKRVRGAHGVIERLFLDVTLAAASASAVIRVGRTADELLLGQREQAACLDRNVRLDGFGGGERPTRATLRLVLGLGDRLHLLGIVGGPPVEVSGQVAGGNGAGHMSGSVGGEAQGAIVALECADLVLGPVAEFGDGRKPRLAAGCVQRVVGDDALDAGLEDDRALDKLQGRVGLGEIARVIGDGVAAQLLASNNLAVNRHSRRGCDQDKKTKSNVLHVGIYTERGSFFVRLFVRQDPRTPEVRRMSM